MSSDGNVTTTYSGKMSDHLSGSAYTPSCFGNCTETSELQSDGTWTKPTGCEDTECPIPLLYTDSDYYEYNHPPRVKNDGWDTSGPEVTFTTTTWSSRQTWSSQIGSCGATYTTTAKIQLSEPFSDSDLKKEIEGGYGGFSAWQSDTLGKGEASSDISAGHSCGSLTKLKYRFKLPTTEADTTYKITWDEVTVSPNKSSSAPKNCSVKGTGDPTSPAKSQEFDMDAPEFESSPDGGTVKKYVSNVKVTVESNSNGDDNGSPETPGSGPGSSGDLAGCSSCSGTGGGHHGGVMIRFTLGKATLGQSSGDLTLSFDKPGDLFTDPAALKVNNDRDDVKVLMDGGHIDQIATKQSVATVRVISSTKYAVTFYNASDTTLMASGRYQVQAGAVPIVSWIIEGVAQNQLRLTEDRNGELKTYEYVYNPADASWSKKDISGDRVEIMTTTPVDPATGIFSVTDVIRPLDVSARDTYKVVRTFRNVSWGTALLQETVGPDEANPQTTYYSYYDWLPANGTFQPVQQIVHADRSWEYFEYDGSGRVSDAYSSFGDQDPPESYGDGTLPFGGNRWLGRHTTYSYDPLPGTSDNADYDAYTARTTTEYVQGVEVARRYVVIEPGLRKDIVWKNANSVWDPLSTDNLTTTTTYYTSGDNIHRVQSIKNSDGTLTTYSYAPTASGGETRTICSGQPNAGSTAVINGIKTVTIVDAIGNVVSKKVYSIAPSVTDILIASEVSTLPDTLGNYTHTTYLDGRQTQIYYSCCGVDRTIDKDGVTTTYQYDGLKRRVAAVSNGITLKSVLDPYGNVLKQIRVGTDNTEMVLREAEYDTAGRLTLERNPLGGETTYDESLVAGRRVKTTTLPNTGTKVETYFKDGTLKRITGSAALPVQYDYGVEDAGEGVYRAYVKTTKVSGATPENEWQKTYTDMVGNIYKTVFSAETEPFPYTMLTYNDKGQLSSTRDADGVVTLYEYNGKGDMEYVTLDVNQNGTRDSGGADRITRTVSTYTTRAGANVDVHRTQTSVWDSSTATATIIKTIDESVDGLASWVSIGDYNATPTASHSVAYGTGNTRTEKDTGPDGNFVLNSYVNGRLQSCQTGNAGLSSFGSTAVYSYDAHGRVQSIKDGAAGTTLVYTYNAADLEASVADPLVKTTDYYNTGLPSDVHLPDNTIVHNDFYATGLLKKASGSRTYPVEYSYDYAGRLKTMKTWRNSADASTAAVTTWNYNEFNGRLKNKTYADTKSVDYEYTAGGRLRTRKWARTDGGGNRVQTTYSYGFDASSGKYDGSLSNISYENDPAATPAVAIDYDRRGRIRTVTRNGLVDTLDYTIANQLKSEAFSGSGAVAGLTVTTGYDPQLRRTSLAANTSTPISVTYAPDTPSRLGTVTFGANTVTYSYLPNSGLISQKLFQQSGVTRLTTTMTYDALSRVAKMSSVRAGATADPISVEYQYNLANQRTEALQADGSYWSFGYDVLGQVNSGKKYFCSATPVPGAQFEYTFDEIGNRTQTKAGGDQAGVSLRVANYTPNAVNQYTSRDVPNKFDVTGVAPAGTVTVNGQTAYRNGDYFRSEVAVNNSGGSVYQSVTVAESGQTSVSKNVFVAQTPESSFLYDYDGNLTRDGRWNYTWNAENRLIQMTSATAVGPQQRIDFEYDWVGRRIGKKVWNNTSGTGAPSTYHRFLYEGWNNIALLDGNNANSILASFVWGTDLSGDLQAAGGVGGLLAMVDFRSGTAGTYLYTFDGNGNVVGLINSADSSLSGRYEYGPFGEFLRATGSSAKLNPFRFSTKYTDDETDFVYYGYRYYNPSSGRWLSRDPIFEIGSVNLSCFVENNPVNAIDAAGLYELQFTGDEMTYPRQVRLQHELKKIGSRAKDLQKQIDDEIKRLKALKVDCECKKKIVKGLDKLKKVMKKLESGINSTSENLEVKEVPMDSIAELKAIYVKDSWDITLPGWDSVLRLNSTPKLRWDTSEGLQKTVFHELTHKYGTEDTMKEGLFHNATDIEDLMKDDIEDWNSYLKLLEHCAPGLRPIERGRPHPLHPITDEDMNEMLR